MITTRRLFLVPLTIRQLETGLNSVSQLSEELGISIVGEMMRGNTESAIQKKLVKMLGVHEELHPWFTYWLIVIRDEAVGAGLVGFKGSPVANGSVEIGYRMAEQYRGCGYMTEAVGALVEWAFTHDDCLRITATHVLADNYPSQSVLTKAGFRKIGSDDEGINYVRDRQKITTPST